MNHHREMPITAPFTLRPDRRRIMLRTVGFAIFVAVSTAAGAWVGIREITRGSSHFLPTLWLILCAVWLLFMSAVLWSQIELLRDTSPLIAADRPGVWIRLTHGVIRPRRLVFFLRWSDVEEVFYQSYTPDADSSAQEYLCVQPKSMPDNVPDIGPVRFRLRLFGTPFAIDLSDARSSSAGLGRVLPPGMRIGSRPEAQ
jgi:hypothetical protein